MKPVSVSCVIHFRVLNRNALRSAFDLDARKYVVSDTAVPNDQRRTQIGGLHSIYRAFNCHVVEVWKELAPFYRFVGLGYVHVLKR